MTTLRDDLGELTTAEDFLDYFRISYEQRVIDRCRLHILQRAHDYLATTRDADDEEPDSGPDSGGVDRSDGGADGQLYERMRAMLEQAYRDFTASHPLKERVFKVLRQARPTPAGERSTFVPLEAVAGIRPRSDESS